MSPKKLILAVDDEPDILSALRDTLEEKFDVITASTGREALELIFARSPSLVIMDVSMPDMDGFEAVRQLRARRSPADPPVIFLSARTQRADVEEGLKLSNFDYIPKPFSPTRLIKKIDEVFERIEIRKRINRSNP